MIWFWKICRSYHFSMPNRGQGPPFTGNCKASCHFQCSCCKPWGSRSRDCGWRRWMLTLRRLCPMMAGIWPSWATPCGRRDGGRDGSLELIQRVNWRQSEIVLRGNKLPRVSCLLLIWNWCIWRCSRIETGATKMCLYDACRKTWTLIWWDEKPVNPGSDSYFFSQAEDMNVTLSVDTYMGDFLQRLIDRHACFLAED